MKMVQEGLLQAPYSANVVHISGLMYSSSVVVLDVLEFVGPFLPFKSFISSYPGLA